jgi:hypothetical protein
MPIVRASFSLLVAISFIGFLAPVLVLPALGSRLDGVELPILFETTTLRLPEPGAVMPAYAQHGFRRLPNLFETAVPLSGGGFVTANIPMQRLQRYDEHGRFLNGWFIRARGGYFSVGLSTAGGIVICTARGRESLLYNLDGTSAGAARPCRYSASSLPSLLAPGFAAIDGVTVRAAETAAAPIVKRQQWLLLPLWSPLVAWAMMVFGMIGLRVMDAEL